MQALKITGSLDVYAAGRLRDSLLEYLRQASTPELDLAAVENCDAVGVQLLCAARRTAEADGKQLAMTNISEPVRALCTALGLAAERLCGGVG